MLHVHRDRPVHARGMQFDVVPFLGLLDVDGVGRAHAVDVHGAVQVQRIAVHVRAGARRGLTDADALAVRAEIQDERGRADRRKRLHRRMLVRQRAPQFVSGGCLIAARKDRARAARA